MPTCSGIPEYAAALKDLMSSDGVHFTESGYRCLASGFTTHLTETLKKKSASVSIISGTSRGHGGRGGGKQSYYWRGFVSPIGTSRPKNHHQAYLQSHSGGGGPIKAAPGSAKSAKFAHGRTPYWGLGRQQKVLKK
jgi:hypothetical protein